MDELLNSVNSIIMSEDDDENSISLKNHSNENSNDCSNYSNYINLASNRHPRLNVLYKKKSLSNLLNQEERRRIILSEQKKKRQSLIETTRFKDLDKKAQQSSKKSYYYSQYANQLMFSEWLEDRPSDFETHWIMSVCPVGKRCLVVAKEGNTLVFNKVGKLIAKHFSKLPGGNKESRVDETIIDCIYSDTLRCYFVLDCICWKNHPITDSETEFRFYWLKCKLNECQGINTYSYDNPYVFRDIPRLESVNNNSIQIFLDSPFEFDVDGVLFYHKEAHYTPGHTPLVGWLKCWMIPEILHIKMANWIMKSMPSDYKSVRDTINQSNIEMEKFKSFLAINNNQSESELNEDEQSIDISDINNSNSSIMSSYNNKNKIDSSMQINNH